MFKPKLLFIIYTAVFIFRIAGLAHSEESQSAAAAAKTDKIKPRIMVIAVEYIDGLEQPASIIQSKMEQGFLRKNFQIIDKSQMELIKEKDAVLSFADPDKAAALGRNYGAEIVIVAEGKASLMETSQPYGVSVFAYEGDLTAKAIKVDTAEIISSYSLQAVERSSGRIPAANKALESVSIQITDTIADEILAKTDKETYNEMRIELVCSNADYVKSKDLSKALTEQASIKSVKERNLTNNVAIIDVEITGDTDSLTNLLNEMQDGPLVRITGKTENRIDLEFAE